MKILISIQTLAVGGAQTFVIRLSNALSREHKVYLYIHNPLGNGNDLISLISEEVEVHQLLLPALLNWIAWKINRLIAFFVSGFSFHDFLNSLYFRRFLSKHKPDLINSHMIGSDEFVAKYSRNIPWVISMHGCYENGLSCEKGFVRRAEYILNCADGLIYPADKNLDVLTTINKSELLVNRKKIYNGVSGEPVEAVRKTNNKLVFGMVARAIPSKGWSQALNAFVGLIDKYPELEIQFLVIADETEYFKELKLKFNHVPGLEFIGFRLNPSEEIRKMDVCLLPTYFAGESLPNSIIEYLSAGKPVIATDIGEIANMISVEGEISGFLIQLEVGKQGVDSNAILRCMEQYVNDSQLLAQHGAVARKAFAKFSLERCVSDYMDFFRQTMQTKRVSNCDETLKS